jgi:single-stranded-DNA-specific exonuclease
VDRILSAMEKNENIVIYGDYDCDGIPGSVILHDLFRKIGYAYVTNYIPHRHLEGYGLNTQALDQFAKDGVSLVVTVDCGIADVVPVTHARALGIDVIVTDHHLPQGELPPAYAIINSKQEGDTYPDNMLCGAGVAFKLSQAILKKGKFEHIPEGWEKWLLDMAGLSTIADMVPLQKENRMLAYFGLKVLRKSPRPGLRALLELAGAYQPELTEVDVGFTIAPRINAASRMDVPMNAFHMLASWDPKVALERARHLHALNDARKLEVARITKEAHRMLSERPPESVVVVGHPDWTVGVVGIVANTLAETWDRPAFVWGKGEGEVLKGSCRSDGRVHLLELMLATPPDTFLHKGGHEFSGGFAVAPDLLLELESRLVVAHGMLEHKENKEPKYTIATELKVREVNPATFRAIALLAPFGVGNPCPHFLFRNVTVLSFDLFGKTKEHLKLLITDEGGGTASAIGFFMTPASFPGVHVVAGATVSLIATLEQSFFRGKRELRLRIVTITP